MRSRIVIAKPDRALLQELGLDKVPFAVDLVRMDDRRYLCAVFVSVGAATTKKTFRYYPVIHSIKGEVLWRPTKNKYRKATPAEAKQVGLAVIQAIHTRNTSDSPVFGE